MFLRFANLLAWGFGFLTTLVLLRRCIVFWRFKASTAYFVARMKGLVPVLRWKLISLIALLCWLWLAAQHF